MPQPSPSHVLIAADVFGVTPELRDFAEQLGAEVRLVSPHGDTAFTDEQLGYAAFLASGAVPAYAALLREALTNASRPFDLAIGFSAGASALWWNVAETTPWLPRQALLYYGSRIREHASLTPACPARLVFAEREASFDPAGLAVLLQGRGLDIRIISGSAHGFMNPLSPGHDPALAAQELAHIKALVRTSPSRQSTRRK